MSNTPKANDMMPSGTPSKTTTTSRRAACAPGLRLGSTSVTIESASHGGARLRVAGPVLHWLARHELQDPVHHDSDLVEAQRLQAAEQACGLDRVVGVARMEVVQVI